MEEGFRTWLDWPGPAPGLSPRGCSASEHPALRKIVLPEDYRLISLRIFKKKNN